MVKYVSRSCTAYRSELAATEDSKRQFDIAIARTRWAP